MSVVQSNDLLPLGIISGKTEFAALGNLEATARAVLTLKTVITAAPSVLLEAGAAAINLKTQFFPAGRLDNEPNWFGAGTVVNKTVLTGAGSIALPSFALVAGKTLLEASARVSEAETGILSLVVDIVPASQSGYYQEYDGWLKVDGVTVPIESYSFEAADTGAGENLNVTISQFSDRAKFVPDAVIEFLTADSGVWTSQMTGKLTSRNHSFGNDGDKPADVFSFSSVSSLNRRLTKTPPTDLVIYDPARNEINSDDYEPVFDSAGRNFTLGLYPLASLSLFGLMNNVFVSRCGFSEVKTNLPDYKIRRADFSVSNSYLAGVAPHVGMFEPLIFPEGDKIWIVDSTQAVPAGFPAPRSLTAERIEGLSRSDVIERIDGFELQFIENDLGDYFTTRFKTRTSQVGSFGAPDYSRTDIEETIREYRVPSQPATIITEVPISRITKIYDGTLNLISRTTETISYDSFGRQKTGLKVMEKLAPLLPSGNQVLQTVRREELTNQYKVHPFIAGKQIQSAYQMRVSGLIAVDTENKYFGKDFPQEFMKAEEAGNLAEGMNLVEGAIETTYQTYRPKRNGQVDVDGATINFVPTVVGKPPVVKVLDSEPKAGDVSLKGQSGKQNTMYVFPNDDWERTDAPVVPFAVGELPLALAFPLARRQLIRRRTKSSKVTVTVIGLDVTIRRGTVFAVRERESNLEANIIVEGYTITGNVEKTMTTIQGREI